MAVSFQGLGGKSKRKFPQRPPLGDALAQMLVDGQDEGWKALEIDTLCLASRSIGTVRAASVPGALGHHRYSSWNGAARSHHGGKYRSRT